MDRRDRVLVVDDEPRLLRLAREVLQAVGYQVITAADGTSALELAATEQPDLVLLDLLLPRGPDGFEVCRRLREFSDVPVIMVTAKARESDKVEGFAAGADDYLTKPFSTRELLARVQAVLKRTRRAEGVGTQSVVTCGRLSLNLLQRRVFVEGNEVRLTATEYELLRHLAQHANCVLLHEQLLAAVWGQEYRDDVQYLRAYVRLLRKKIESDPAKPKLLVTVPGVGYLLDCPAD